MDEILLGKGVKSTELSRLVHEYHEDLAQLEIQHTKATLALLQRLIRTMREVTDGSDGE